MSAEALEHEHHGHTHSDPHQRVAHQFSDRAQQDESYIVGMWTFLVTEIMFFGALFLAYAIYRSQYPQEIAAASRELNVGLGFINTLILLTSSLTMAFGVRASILKNKGQQLACIGLTLLCAFGFLFVKYFEYKAKFDHHLVPGPSFVWPPEHGESHAAAPGDSHGAATGTPGSDTHGAAPGADTSSHPPAGAVPTLQAERLGSTGAEAQTGFVSIRSSDEIARGRAQLYIGLYFIMTGLHGFHVVIGILILGTIWMMIAFDHKAIQDFIPIELAGLYWHFVDIVWIFLYPLLYLIHPKSLFGG